MPMQQPLRGDQRGEFGQVVSVADLADVVAREEKLRQRDRHVLALALGGHRRSCAVKALSFCKVPVKAYSSAQAFRIARSAGA
jgi:hypothetical protein